MSMTPIGRWKVQDVARIGDDLVQVAMLTMSGASVTARNPV
jgi:3-deoxy-D-manno-octulosonate 8-phosphate phosphatase KdsC-like HAD superfamily phosphatase